jgi:hypothetical protein
MRRSWVCVLAVLWIVSTCVPVSAAELRISFAELARLVQLSLTGSQLRLHNVPPGIFDFSPGSSLTIGGSQTPIAVPARTFVVAGTTYAYYLNNINSSSIRIAAVKGALRLSVVFETDKAELVGHCVTGFCISDQALPEVQWVGATVTVDVAPILVNGLLSFEFKTADVGGSFSPDCATANGLFVGSVCRAILPSARQALARLKGDVNTGLKTQLNAPETQAKLAAGLRERLKFGAAGELRVSKVAVESEAMTLTFCLACQP